MKNNFIIWLAICLMALLTFGCVQPEVQPEEIETPTEKTIDAYIADDATKVEIANDGTFTWSVGDQIAVHYTSGSTSGYAISSALTSSDISSSGKKATFHVTYPGTLTGHSYYPASSVNTSTGDIAFPSSYTLSSSELASSKCSMRLSAEAPSSESSPLTFRHMGGIMRITVNNVPASANKLRVRFHNSGSTDPIPSYQRVNGEFTPQQVGDNWVCATTSESAMPVTGTITFNIPTGTTWRDGVVLNIPVPTGSFAQVEVTALNGSSEELLTLKPRFRTTTTSGGTTVVTENWTCQAGHGKKMTVALPAFAVSEGNTSRVIVARSNLRVESEGKPAGTSMYYMPYRLMDNPWNIDETSDVDAQYYSSSQGKFTSNISLFGWGSSSQNYSGSGDNTRYPYCTFISSISNIYGPNRDLSYNDKSDWGYTFCEQTSQSNYRTPTKDEFKCLLDLNCNPSGLGAIKDEYDHYIYGLIILPHGCKNSETTTSKHLPKHHTVEPTYYMYRLSTGVGTFEYNLFTIAEWRAWEDECGAIFLPCAGRRHGTEVTNVTSGGSTAADSDDYWGMYYTSTYWGDSYPNRIAYYVRFRKNESYFLYPDNRDPRFVMDAGWGYSVRLIKTIN